MGTKQCEHRDERELHFYCPAHKLLLCNKCSAEGHSKCKGITNVKETGYKLKDCELYDEIVEKLNQAFDRVNIRQKDIFENLSDFERGRVVFKNTLVHYKRKVMEHLDTLEEKILEDYDKLYKEYYSALKKTEDVMGRHLLELKHNLAAIEEKSDQILSDSFDTVTKISTDLNSKNEYKELSLDYEEVSIEFRMIKDMLLFSNIETIGTLSVVKKPKIKPLEREVTFSTISREERRFRFSDILAIETENNEYEIIDLKEMANGEIVMTDRLSECLLIFNVSQRTTRRIQVGEYPDCIAVVDKSTVAVTQGRTNVVIVDVTIGKVLKTINMDDRAEGITLVQAKLIVNCRNKGLQILTVSGDLVGAISSFTGRLYLLGTGIENMLCSDQVNNSITCLSLEGETLFTCSLAGLKEPYGITVDNHGNFYVAGMKSSAIYKFSADGSDGTRFLRPRDGLKQPYVLLWRKDGSILISNKSGRSVEVFKYC